MSRNRLILVILLLLALAGGWYYGSPLWTVSRMKAAAEAGDADALAAYVDFPPLREDMKRELRAAILAGSRRNGSRLSAGEAMLAAALVGPAVDSFVTPSGLGGLFVAGAAAQAAAPEPLRAMQLGERPQIVRRGLSEFRVSPQGRTDPAMIFTRRGLGWRLSGIELGDQPE